MIITTVIDTINDKDLISREMRDEIDDIWDRYELVNGFHFPINKFYIEEFGETIPNIVKFMEENDIRDCLIRLHW
jgi:hypothetical protein